MVSITDQLINALNAQIQAHPVLAMIVTWHCKDPWTLYGKMADSVLRLNTYRQPLICALKIWIRVLKGLAQMPSLMIILPMAVTFAQLAFKMEQIETDASKDAATKRTDVLAEMPALEALVDQAAGLPAGAVEKYLTPSALALIYDAAAYAEAKIAASLNAPTDPPQDPNAAV